eukprot:766998-Hanusia_phi.AAC.2
MACHCPGDHGRDDDAAARLVRSSRLSPNVIRSGVFSAVTSKTNLRLLLYAGSRARIKKNTGPGGRAGTHGHPVVCGKTERAVKPWHQGFPDREGGGASCGPSLAIYLPLPQRTSLTFLLPACLVRVSSSHYVAIAPSLFGCAGVLGKPRCMLSVDLLQRRLVQHQLLGLHARKQCRRDIRLFRHLHCKPQYSKCHRALNHVPMGQQTRPHNTNKSSFNTLAHETF